MILAENRYPPRIASGVGFFGIMLNETPPTSGVTSDARDDLAQPRQRKRNQATASILDSSCPALCRHPRLESFSKQDVDGSNEFGHDDMARLRTSHGAAEWSCVAPMHVLA
jgi:hypothetical protein